MLCLFSKDHKLHNPKEEIHRGERVPCFEKPERADFILTALRNDQHEIKTDFLDSTAVIKKIHDEKYLAFIANAWQEWTALDAENDNKQPFPSIWPVPGLFKQHEPQNFIAKLGFYSTDNSTPLVKGSWQVAKQGADGAYTAAHALKNDVSSVFCLSRPPGHHAGSNFMGGYCFLNNAAIAAQSLRDLGCARVSILDVDYHHGNGTQQIFYARNDVQLINIHADPATNFPFFAGYADERGEGIGEGYNINYPLPHGASAAQWFAALEKAVQNIKAYKPDALVISLGLDTYVNDPISSFNHTTADFIELGRRIKQLNLPSLFILEGGYAVKDLGINTAAVLSGFEQN